MDSFPEMRLTSPVFCHILGLFLIELPVSRLGSSHVAVRETFLK